MRSVTESPPAASFAFPRLPTDLPTSQPRYVGRDVPRAEDPALLTGRAEYGDNIRLPGMLHAAILRSPHASARIKRLDVSRALQLPGVAAALTGQEVMHWSQPVFGIPEGWTGYALAVDRVHWVGEPVAAVAATSRYLAEDALELIECDYEPLEPMLDAMQAADGAGPYVLEGKDSNLAYARTFRFGDVESAFSEADVVVHQTFRWHRNSGNPIETCVCIAEWDPYMEMLTVRGSHRSPQQLVPGLVAALRIPSTQIRISQSPLGGSFGVKSFGRYVVLLSLLARKLGGRPVKWTEDRLEHLIGSTTHAWDRHYQCELAVKKDGLITGFRARLVDDFGAFAEWVGAGMIFRPLLALGGCYRLRNIEYDCKVVLTNRAPQGPYRGFGLPPHYWVLEQLVDLAAKRLGMDSAELRRRNFVGRDEFPYVSPTGNVYDSGDYQASLDKLLQSAAYGELKRQKEAARAEGRLVGLSVVTTIEPGMTAMALLGLASPRIFGGTSTPEGVLVRMDAYGKVMVEVGFPWGGQSQHSFVRQVLADYFSIKLEDVQVMTVDSLTMQPGLGPIASRMAVGLSGAILGAAGLVADKLRRVAAVMLETDADDVELFDGHFRIRGAAEKALPVQTVARFMLSRADLLPEEVGGSPEAVYVYNPPDRSLPDDQGRARYSLTSANAVHLCMLEVDPDTGQVTILKYAMVDDCGTRLNPSVVRGMLQGGLAHGVGSALLEEYVYDEQGQILTSTYMDYLMPTIMEVPMAEEYPMSSPSPFTALGVKGIGEAAIHTAPAAILCAINDALEPLGARITEAPASPLRIWKAIQRATSGPSATIHGEPG